MSWRQLVVPNLATAGNIGWCLAFAEAAFGTPYMYHDATVGWNAATLKHPDQDFPAGMYVPIWFSYVLNGEDLGHVAIRMPDGRVFSSPWQIGTTHAILPNIDELIRIYSNNGQHPLTYRGWTEDIAGVHVVEYEADAPPAPKYTVVEEYPGGKLVKLNKQPTNLWGMNYDFDYMKDHPVEVHDAGEIITVTNKVKHADGYEYYRRDGQVDGFNVLDCDDYTPPPPPEPKPYIPPAAPVTAQPAQRYEVVTTIPYYGNQQDAQFKKNQLGTITAQVYSRFEASDSTVQLGDDNMHPKYWINIKDNVAPVIVPVSTRDDTWKSTRQFFYSDRNKYDLYELQADVVLHDLDNKGKDYFLTAFRDGASDNAVLKVYGTVWKDEVKYYLLHEPEDKDWYYWYCIPVVNKHTGKAYLLKYSDVYDTSAKKHDLSAGEEALAAFINVGYKIMDVLSPRKIRAWIDKKY